MNIEWTRLSPRGWIHVVEVAMLLIFVGLGLAMTSLPLVLPVTLLMLGGTSAVFGVMGEKRTSTSSA